MRRNKWGRVAALALTLTCVTMTLLSGTLAKYTTTVSGQDSATVAKFAFEAKTGSKAYTTATETVDMFDSKDTIAPGDAGTFNVILDNSKSEVPITVTSTTTVTNVDKVNIKFAIGESEPKDYDLTADTLATSLKSSLDGVLTAKNAAKTIKVYWKWVDDDTNDTALGVKGAAKVSIKIEVTAEQKQTTTSP